MVMLSAHVYAFVGYDGTQALGMTLLQKRSNVPNEASLIARLGYGTEADSTIMELRYKYAQEKVSSLALVSHACLQQMRCTAPSVAPSINHAQPR